MGKAIQDFSSLFPVPQVTRTLYMPHAIYYRIPLTYSKYAVQFINNFSLKKANCMAGSAFGMIVFGSLVNSCQLQMHGNLMNYPSIEHKPSAWNATTFRDLCAVKVHFGTGCPADTSWVCLMWHSLQLKPEQLFKMKWKFIWRSTK